MAAATALSVRSYARQQFQAVFSGIIAATCTLNPASLVDAAGETDTAAVTGVKLGDFVLVALKEDLQGITVTAYVSAADTVSIRVQNESGGTIDLASITVNILALRPEPNLFF